jgi:hypothetical protein
MAAFLIGDVRRVLRATFRELAGAAHHPPRPHPMSL